MPKQINTMPLKSRECKHCGRTFEAEFFALYCEMDECQDVANITEQDCDFCGKEFIKDNREKVFYLDVKNPERMYSSNMVLYFCSDECLRKEENRITLERCRNISLESKRNQLKGLPKKYHNITTDKIDYLKTVNSSIFVHGVSGVGKSVFLSTLYKVLRAKRKQCVWINFNKLIFEIQKGFETKTAYTKLDDMINTNDIFFIDDLGSEKLSDFTRSIMYSLINHIEEEEKELYITSNMSIKEIAIKIDDRISSRISGICKIVNMTGNDRRTHK